MSKKAYTVKEAALLLGYHENYICSLIKKGRIVGKKWKGKWYITEESILERLKDNPFLETSLDDL